MAIRVDIPNIGIVEVNGIAEEATMQEILATLQKRDQEKTNKATAEQDKMAKAAKRATSALDDQIEQTEKEIESAKEQEKTWAKVKKAVGATTDALNKLGMGELLEGMGELAGAGIDSFAKYLKEYDRMAAEPVKAGADMLQFIIDVTSQIAKLTLSITSAIGQSLFGWIPFVGAGIAKAIGKIEGLAQEVVDFAADIFTFANDLLRQEFEKRIQALGVYAANFISIAGGLSDVATLAGSAGLPIKMFAEAVSKARPYINQIGLAGGDAAKQLSRAMAGLATTTGRGGRALRDELFAMGISFEEQGAVMAQYMAQQRSFGRDIAAIPADELARGSAEYAKHLRVLSDLTGQDASKLMEQARAEAQRGALMEKLSANQARAFQDSFAIFSTLPDQQGAKLQSALAQLLAGGVVTDPIIAGNKVVMEMLQKTAAQVSLGNINMVTATQSNLADAAIAFRQSGESVTDFATLMSPGGTGAVAQGMAQFGNALRQYRYDPGAAKAALSQTEAMANASGEYVALTETMMGFQIQMEQFAGEALPTYTKALIWATETTLDVVKDGIKYVKNVYEAGGDAGKQLAAMVTLVADLMNAPETPGGPIAGKLEDFLPGLGRLASMGSGSTTSMHEEEGDVGDFPQPSLFDLFDDGGISTGPVSGYQATLHGTEAIVPLPDGGKIPVEIKSQPASTVDSMSINNLTSAVKEQNTMMGELVSLMEKNNSLTSGILQHSM